MSRLSSECAQRTSATGILHVTLTEEGLCDGLQRRFRTPARLGWMGRQALLALTDRMLERFEDQRITRRKMAVERAMRQPRAAHAISDAERLDAVFANLSRRSLQNALPALSLLCLRITHFSPRSAP